MKTTLQEMARQLLLYDEFIIVYHIRPDGDCIGSAYALSLALRSTGRKCRVAGSDPVPQKHRFLTDAVPQDTITHPVYISVDTRSPERAGSYAHVHFTFCVDHHHGNTIDADFKYVEEDCGACSEIIFKLIQAMNIPVTPQMATLLYTALVMDTRGFLTSDTSPQSFETAAALKRLGADTWAIGRRYITLKSRGYRMIEDFLKNSLRFFCQNRLVIGMITLADLEAAQIADSELEGINSFVEQYEEMLIGVTVRELPGGRSRCSTRTVGDISADRICQMNGGGGHFHAAVCDLDVPPEEARLIMEETCKKVLKEYDGDKIKK